MKETIIVLSKVLHLRHYARELAIEV